ncbi:hypothetical protein [Tuwongella immobilis]|uniref:Uncharacterized protein n=1 Tax=Tuwongella immobilis TaxID=692036 RepID=A0A6C2YNQ3_9BACT|nr:hypothetical protein [Tuwongella immobilis]VIP03066.1 unnamed protein product [Tuwongella immobilis]VTS03285.1 unnamed protein product [Tuwongella immobilis]
MAHWAGEGGTVTMTETDVDWPVAKWTLDKSVALANTTSSKSNGIKQRHATIKNQQVTFEVPWDDAINPEASGFDEGKIIKVVLNAGRSGKKWTSPAVIIEKCTYVNDEDEDVVRLSVTGYANVAFTYS